VLMAGQGSMVTDWKAVDVFTECSDTPAEPIPEPIPGEPIPGETRPSGKFSPDDSQIPGRTRRADCLAYVMFTTRYELSECPNGEVSINRFGEGVVLTSPTTGDFFGWGEATACNDGPFKGSGDRADRNRPLELENIVKTMK
jgi:hypothetical protein